MNRRNLQIAAYVVSILIVLILGIAGMQTQAWFDATVPGFLPRFGN